MQEMLCCKKVVTTLKIVVTAFQKVVTTFFSFSIYCSVIDDFLGNKSYSLTFQKMSSSLSKMSSYIVGDVFLKQELYNILQSPTTFRRVVQLFLNVVQLWCKVVQLLL